MACDSEEEREQNQRSCRRLRRKIDEMYPTGQYVAIVRGKVVADAPTFPQLITQLRPIESDPERRLVVQAGVNYPQRAIDLQE